MGQSWDRHEIPSVRGPVALVPKEANAGKSGAGGYSICPDSGKLVEIPPVTGAKRQRWTASDTAGNQEIGRLCFLYAAWLPLIHAATQLVSKFIGSDGGAGIAARQSLARPLYTPNSLLPEMSERMLETVALYAGECIRDISYLQPAGHTVLDLAGPQ